MGGRKLGKREVKRTSAELQERDFQVLRMLAKARLLYTSSFVPTVFPSREVARRRLRKLKDLRYIAVYTTVLHDEDRFVLDRRGQLELAEEDGRETEPRSAPRRSPELGEHHRMLVAFWSRVVHECDVAQGLELLRFSFEWELAPPHLNTLVRFRPDAVVVVDDGEREHPLLLEVDLGTESATYVAKHKAAVFARLHATETPVAEEVATALLLVVPSTRRLRALARAIKPSAVPVFGRAFDRNAEADVLSSGWFRLDRLPDGESPDGLSGYSLLELLASLR